MSPPGLDTWEQLSKGTLCRVKGRGSRPFAFQYASVNALGEVEITLYGPKQADGRNHDGHMSFVTCPAARVAVWARGRLR